MAKKNVDKVKEELFAPTAEIKEEVKSETPVENIEATPVPEVQEAAEAAEAAEDNGMEMELELDGEELVNEMEPLVAEKVKQEEQQKQEDKSKRGPKGPRNKDEAEATDAEGNPAKEEPKKKELNLSDQNTIQREIKKGRISAPQGRIEKLPDSNEYILKLAPGVIFPKDAKDVFEVVDTIKVMNDGKFQLTAIACERLGTEKFTAQHESGQEVQHSYIRVELHKPGRDKDVVHLFTPNEARRHIKELQEKNKRKEDEAAKKAEKEAKKKAEESAAKESEAKPVEENKEAAV